MNGEIATGSEIQTVEQAILKTVAFFDIFIYPLTAWEIFCWSSWPSGADYRLVLIALEKMIVSGRLERGLSFYYLPGRGELVAIRQERYTITAQKFKRALKAVRLFRWLPWLQGVAMANLIGSHNLRAESDIDLVLITAPKRLWLSRLLIGGVTQVLGWRPRPGYEQDSICLSFWLSNDQLDVQSVVMGERDYYFRYWLAGLTPVYERNHVFYHWRQANQWVYEHFPLRASRIINFWRRVEPIWPEQQTGLSSSQTNWFEDLAKKIQLRKLANNLRRIMNQDTRVVINDQMLKLHSNDRRMEFNQEYEKRLAQIR
ncbi:MAG: hypothetical protein WCK11_05040 [Candidatus Falkowbacteria bacterium]